MREKNDPDSFDDFVLLGMAGIPEAEIHAQVEKLTRSPAFESTQRPKQLLEYLVNKALEGKAPRASEIARDIFRKDELFNDDAIVRNTMNKVRDCLQTHYTQYAKAGEIRLHIRDREYLVLAPPRATSTTVSRLRLQPESALGDFISDPENDTQVHFRTTVRGQLTALSFDMRAWLVIKIPVGLYYPQCRISRDAPEWEHEVRVGLAGWGTNEDAVYEINLVSAGSDGDTEFYQYVKSARDGFGFVLPSDCRILDTKRVIRRDIRANEPGKPSA